MPAKWDFAKLGENWEFCGDIREELCLHFIILRNFLKLVRQLFIFGNEMARAYHRAYIYTKHGDFGSHHFNSTVSHAAPGCAR